MSEVKWPWALNKNGEQVKIDSVKKNEIEEYRCIICGEKVIPKLGDKNKHHFCHYGKINPSIDHSPESYLHKTFKNTLYSLLACKIKKDEKFIVQWDASNLGLKKTNIIRNQAEIKIEEPLSNEENHKKDYIPDIILYDSNHIPYLAIEIVVTHETTKEKLAYYSDNNISLIEIHLNKDLSDNKKSDKIDFSVLENVEERAGKPDVFSYIPDLVTLNLKSVTNCKKCNSEMFFSYLNITKVKCPSCGKLIRVAFGTGLNKDSKYPFTKYITQNELSILDLHGLNYKLLNYDICFICSDCLREIPPLINHTKEIIKHPLSYCCPKCQHIIKDGVVYNNIKLQNKSEKKWAEFFDERGITWSYNPEKYRLSKINPFFVFELTDSQQLFRGSVITKEPFDKEKRENEYKKARILANEKNREVIIGYEDGTFTIYDADYDWADGEEAQLVECNKCQTLYFNHYNRDKWTCKHCGYFNKDNTHIVIKTGDEPFPEKNI